MRRLVAVRAQEEGLGIVEVIVSLMLMAIVAVVFLPIVVTAVTASTVNSQAVAAVQIAGRELDQRTQGGGLHRCSDLSDWFAGATHTESVPQGGQLTVHRSGEPLGAACDGGDAVGTARLRVTITDAESGRTFANPSTIVRVESD